MNASPQSTLTRPVASNAKTYHATGHCREQADREQRRATIRALLDVTGLTPEAAIDLILTNDRLADNWRAVVADVAVPA